MSWWLIFALAVTAYALKALGAVALGGREFPDVVRRCLGLIPAALLAALIAKDTFTSGQQIGIDARLAGLVVAVVLTLKKAPLPLVLVLGVGSTALVRLVA